MGLSTSYANILTIVVFLWALMMISGALSDYIDGTHTESILQGRLISERLGTDVTLSAISTSTSDNIVRIYAVNSGRTAIQVNCTDFYVDREWIRRTDMEELVLLNTTFDPGVWNPGETLKMSVQVLTDRDVPHEGRVVTCNGVSASSIFYWAS